KMPSPYKKPRSKTDTTACSSGTNRPFRKTCTPPRDGHNDPRKATKKRRLDIPAPSNSFRSLLSQFPFFFSAWTQPYHDLSNGFSHFCSLLSQFSLFLCSPLSKRKIIFLPQIAYSSRNVRGFVIRF